MVIIDGNDILLGIAAILVLLFIVNWARKRTKNIKRNFVYIPGLMRGRECNDSIPHFTIRSLEEDFKLNGIEESTTPEEYFVYIMNGLHWPVLETIKFDAESHIILYVTSLIHGTNKTHSVRLWIFGKTKPELLKGIYLCLNNYKNSGCPYSEIKEPIESILARARGQSVDLMKKYGFVWGDESCQ